MFVYAKFKLRSFTNPFDIAARNQGASSRFEKLDNILITVTTLLVMLVMADESDELASHSLH